MSFSVSRKFSNLILISMSLAGLVSAKRLDRAYTMEPVPSDQQIPVIDFFRPHYFQQPAINPAGTLIAALNPDKDDSYNLIIFDLAAQKTVGTGGGEGFDIYGFQWLNERRILFGLKKDKLYLEGLFAGDADKLQRVIPLSRHDEAIPVGFPRSDPLKPLIWFRQLVRQEGADGGVMQIDSMRNVDSASISSAVRTFPAPKGGTVVAYYSDTTGELAHAITMKDGVNTLHRFAFGQWLPCPGKTGELPIVGPGDRKDELIVLARSDEADGRHPKLLRRYDSSTGEMGAVIYRDEKYDPDPVSFYRSPDDHRIVGLSFNRKGPETVWLDPAYNQIQKEVSDALPGGVARILGSDRKEERFLVEYYSDRKPALYFSFQRNPAKVTFLANSAPWIDSKRMQPMQLITYKSRDGSTIEGYYTTPATQGNSRPPLIVLPHGGPWVRDVWSWDGEVQFLVSRGYAVFQPNYRGSPGSGWRFPEEDQWAFRKMHEDVTDGVRALIKSSLVDPDRIAIMGGSFGAYLALSGAVHEGSLYRCAVTIAGVFDWEQVMRETKAGGNSSTQYGILKRFLGDPKLQKARFNEISPMRAVDHVSIPIFVAHGSDDPIASVNESKRLISELKKRKIPHEVMIENGEGHGFHHVENRVEMYTRVEAFLAKYLAPRSVDSLSAQQGK